MGNFAGKVARPPTPAGEPNLFPKAWAAFRIQLGFSIPGRHILRGQVSGGLFLWGPTREPSKVRRVAGKLKQVLTLFQHCLVPEGTSEVPLVATEPLNTVETKPTFRFLNMES